MTEIFPARVQPYAKAMYALLGTIVSTLLVTLPAAPHWLVIVSSVLSAVAVYFAPNVPKSAPKSPTV